MEAASLPSTALPRTRRLGDRVGDGLLFGLTALAAIFCVLVVFAIMWRVADGAWPAIERFKLGFLWRGDWNVTLNQFGARELIVGTIVTSFGAMLIAAPLSIAIGLFLSELAPPAVRAPVGTLVDLLAALPSVVIGLWGIYVLAPFSADHLQPAVHATLGWIPVFGGDPHTESTVFTAILVLTIMTIPITSSICRELFLGVPKELEEGSLALGATRWEMARTVVVPSVRGGVVAAIILGLGRALGEAIAVTQVIGNFIPLKQTLFAPGDTIASRLANQYQGAATDTQIAALIYLALILLVITVLTNYAAQRVVKRFG
ncbi:MAG TPA: phosphate ABC transporter permease subunit PstC [Gaiellaceae bacterium]|nr:phosphate ABC transporter permease subunit PstC [Gaiellaceae bacterium]